MKSPGRFWQRLTSFLRPAKEYSILNDASRISPQDNFAGNYPTAVPQISEHAISIARSIRNNNATGSNRDTNFCKPAILLLGVTPRSGTVHVGNLIQLHPEIAEYPNDIWEIPFLSSTNHLIQFQNSFFQTYSMNDGKLGQDDFLAIFGSAFLKYLNGFVPTNRRLFVKEPRVEHLDYFFATFPDEYLVLLMRDGRDVVNSTIRSWPDMNFETVTKQWQAAAEQVIRFEKNNGNNPKLHSIKFEDVLADPDSFIKKLCKQTKLALDQYPFEKIGGLPVQGSSAIQTGGKVDWNPKEKPAGFNPVGRWNSWSPKMKNQFKRLAGDTLLKLGYADDLNW